MPIDPLLHTGTNSFIGSQTMNYDARIAELQQAQQVLQQQKMQAEAAAAGKPQQPSSATPIWDEIDSICAATHRRLQGFHRTGRSQ